MAEGECTCGAGSAEQPRKRRGRSLLDVAAEKPDFEIIEVPDPDPAPERETPRPSARLWWPLLFVMATIALVFAVGPRGG